MLLNKIGIPRSASQISKGNAGVGRVDFNAIGVDPIIPSRRVLLPNPQTHFVAGTTAARQARIGPTDPRTADQGDDPRWPQTSPGLAIVNVGLIQDKVRIMFGCQFCDESSGRQSVNVIWDEDAIVAILAKRP